MNIFSFIIGLPLCFLFTFLAIKLFVGLIKDIKSGKNKVVSDKVDDSDNGNNDNLS